MPKPLIFNQGAFRKIVSVVENNLRPSINPDLCHNILTYRVSFFLKNTLYTPLRRVHTLIQRFDANNNSPRQKCTDLSNRSFCLILVFFSRMFSFLSVVPTCLQAFVNTTRAPLVGERPVAAGMVKKITTLIIYSKLCSIISNKRVIKTM